MGSIGTGAASSRLFEPLKIGGSLTLQHRLVMAPLTRFRADEHHVPLPSTATYYAQRGSVPGTLLISEATFISKKAGNYPNAPGIYTSEQIEAWRRVTDAVHARGSYIFLQLWALGRTAKPDPTTEMVSSSPTPVDSDSETPRELTHEEIRGYVDDYAQAARNAIAAGFDGVEIHAANGYLIDQFTQDICNVRTDAYGGSIENRTRFALEVTRAVVDAVGAHRTGIRLSPFSTYMGMKMADPVPQFTYLVEQLRRQFATTPLAFLHVVEARITGNTDIDAPEKIDFLVRAWDNHSPVLIAGGYKPASARVAVDEEYKGYDVAIVFGRYWISSPDLPFRIANGLDLAPYDRSTFYTPMMDAGYIDYPFSKEFETAGVKVQA